MKGELPLIVNLERLLLAEKVESIKNFMRVRLSKIGTKSVFVDSVEYKVLEAYIETIDNQPDFENLKFSPVSEYRVSCDS